MQLGNFHECLIRKIFINYNFHIAENGNEIFIIRISLKKKSQTQGWPLGADLEIKKSNITGINSQSTNERH